MEPLYSVYKRTIGGSRQTTRIAEEISYSGALSCLNAFLCGLNTSVSNDKPVNYSIDLRDGRNINVLKHTSSRKPGLVCIVMIVESDVAIPFIDETIHRDDIETIHREGTNEVGVR